jgi:hypothetical protein
MSAEQSDDQAIAKLAYQLWESRGRPASSAEQDWLEAEAIFAAAKARNAAAGGIPTLDTPANVKTERRKSRAKKTTSTRAAERRDPDSL